MIRRLFQDVFCEPSISIKNQKETLLIQTIRSTGKQPIDAPEVPVKISGGENLGSFIDVSICPLSSDFLYFRELDECNMTISDLTIKIVENNTITNNGLKLGGKRISPHSFRLRRASRRTDLASPFDIQCLIKWKSTTKTCSSIVGCDPIEPQYNTLFSTETAALYFIISVDIFCDDSLPLGSWRNIIHVTNGGVNGYIGNRVFGIWRKDSSAELHISISHPTYSGKQTTVEFPCDQGEWSTYTLELTKATIGFVNYSVKKDGNELLAGSYEETGAYSSGPFIFMQVMLMIM